MSIRKIKLVLEKLFDSKHITVQIEECNYLVKGKYIYFYCNGDWLYGNLVTYCKRKNRYCLSGLGSFNVAHYKFNNVRAARFREVVKPTREYYFTYRG